MNTNNRLDFDTVVEKCQYLYVDDCENMTEEEVVGDVCSQIESMGWTCISEWEDPTDFIDDIEGCKDCGSILNSELELSYNLGEFYIDNSERNRKNKSFGDEEYVLSVYDENENEVIRIYFVLVYKLMPYELEAVVRDMFNN